MGKWGNVETAERGNGNTGEWGNGDMGKWVTGAMGQWGTADKYPITIPTPISTPEVASTPEFDVQRWRIYAEHDGSVHPIVTLWNSNAGE